MKFYTHDHWHPPLYPPAGGHMDNSDVMEGALDRVCLYCSAYASGLSPPGVCVRVSQMQPARCTQAPRSTDDEEVRGSHPAQVGETSRTKGKGKGKPRKGKPDREPVMPVATYRTTRLQETRVVRQACARYLQRWNARTIRGFLKKIPGAHPFLPDRMLPRDRPIQIVLRPARSSLPSMAPAETQLLLETV